MTIPFVNRPTELSANIVYSYRILYTGPKYKFHVNRLIDLELYEVLLMISFLVIIALKLLAFALLDRGRKRHKCELVYRTFSGCLGQENYRRPQWISTAVNISVFFFVVYINYVLKSATLISELSTEPSRMYKSLDSVKRSDVPLFVGVVDVQYDQHLFAAIE